MELFPKTLVKSAQGQPLAVVHFSVDNIDDLCFHSLIEARVRPDIRLRLVDFTDELHGRELAEKKNIWAKKRTFSEKSEYSIKFTRYQQLGPLQFSLYSAASIEQLSVATLGIFDFLPNLHDLFSEKPFLTISTRRIESCVHAAPLLVSCWVEASCKSDKTSLFFVSCGVRYPVSDQGSRPYLDVFEQLFTNSQPCSKLQYAPSKALVFSEIYEDEQLADSEMSMNFLKCMRARSPFDDLALTNSDDMSVWAERWLGRNFNKQTESTQAKTFLQLAKSLNETSAEEVFSLCPLGLRDLFAKCLGLPFDKLELPQQQAIAGLCGCLRMWRIPFRIPGSIASLGELLKHMSPEQRLHLLRAMTVADMSSGLAVLPGSLFPSHCYEDGRGEECAESVLEDDDRFHMCTAASITSSAQTNDALLIEARQYMDQHFIAQAALAHLCRQFQRAVAGCVVCVPPL